MRDKYNAENSTYSYSDGSGEVTSDKILERDLILHKLRGAKELGLTFAEKSALNLKLVAMWIFKKCQ